MRGLRHAEAGCLVGAAPNAERSRGKLDLAQSLHLLETAKQNSMRTEIMI